jgi:hypothetical protein
VTALPIEREENFVAESSGFRPGERWTVPQVPVSNQEKRPRRKGASAKGLPKITKRSIYASPTTAAP